jgi:aminoglycoside/choline kinase family phosphotransferase
MAEAHRIEPATGATSVHEPADERGAALARWLRLVLAADCTLRPIAGDAGGRRYFRVTHGAQTAIAAILPPLPEDGRRYLRISERFAGLGLNVPLVLSHDLERGFLLVTDLGEQLYLNALNDERVERLYGDALGALVVLQAGGFTDPGFLPPYDERVLRTEMQLFDEWYLGRHLGLAPDAGCRAALDTVFAQLTRSARTQPRVWVHRDFHSRNLVVTGQNNPGILDFQDAVSGPITYDLASLLRDCYIAWPQGRVEEWALGYHELARQSGLPVGEDEGQFLRWFDLMGIQRHLKAVGLFARLHHRDGKDGYLADIPRTLDYIRAVAARYPELQALDRLLGGLEAGGGTA